MKFSNAEKSRARPTQNSDKTKNKIVPREKKNALLKEYMGKAFKLISNRTHWQEFVQSI
jgi:hypothetical protein